jgi:hypothetical protein
MLHIPAVLWRDAPLMEQLGLEGMGALPPTSSTTQHLCKSTGVQGWAAIGRATFDDTLERCRRAANAGTHH